MAKSGGRRSGTGIIRAAVLLVVIPLVCGGCWFQVGGNAFHTGFNATEHAITKDSWPGLHRVWRARVNPAQATYPPSSASVANNAVFVVGVDGQLDAYDVGGNTNCSGTPKTCTPLWTAATGGAPSSSMPADDPATDGATVFVGGVDGKLYAFDAHGETNCGGSPRTCTPLWTASLSTSSVFTPVVAGNRVFVGTADGGLFALDSHGDTNCGGTPRTCTPLWRATTDEEYGSIGNLPAPAVTDSFVIYPGLHSLNAFDPAGQNGCSGTPVTCTPVWTSSFGADRQTLGWPVVGGGLVFQSLVGTCCVTVAVDAAGVAGCHGTPAVCEPRFTLQTDSAVTPAYGPDGTVYTAWTSVRSFSSDGTTGCSGTPVVCQPLHQASITDLTLAPALAGDLVIVAVWNTQGPSYLAAFDRATLEPQQTFPLGTTTALFPAKVVVDAGLVLESTSDGFLQAWGP